MPDKKTYHHGDLRTALVQEAAALIAVEGVDAVTMRGLSQRIGVSRTAPYRHFADKDALLAAVAAEGFSTLRQHLHTAIEAHPHGAASFESMGVAYVLFATDHAAYYRLMYGREALDRERFPDLHAAAHALYDELVALIRQQQEAGTIRGDRPEALAYVAWSTVHGLASLLVDGQMEAPPDIAGLARLTIQTLLVGLQT
ncbi:MAG: TetR/AcrR family transcriptional regulator [Bacteroidota bacterium]